MHRNDKSTIHTYNDITHLHMGFNLKQKPKLLNKNRH